MELEKIGRYEIKANLGQGGMSSVYHAYDPFLERDVALKLLDKKLLKDSKFRKRFELEVKTVSRIDHPRIVPIYDYGEEEDTPFLVMRLMTGGSLTDRIREGGLSLEETLEILQQIAPALDETHQMKIVHRDLKPDNILFDHEGLPGIIDFGIVKMIGGDNTTLTGGGIVGTPAYMSPEQVSGRLINARSDIYSLGIVTFQMLAGRRPFDADTPLALAIKHVMEQPPSILEFRPDLPDGIEKVIQKVLQKEPEKRYATASEFVKDLQTACTVSDLVEFSDADQFYDYLKDLGRGSYLRYEAKLLLVGEGGVGKSSLLRALQGKAFVQGLPTTHGVDIQPYRFTHPTKPEATITLNVWDFGGQQIYHTTHQFFMTARSLYLLVWNARGDTEQARLDHWLRNIKVLAPDAPVFLVATHVEGRPLDFNYARFKEAYPQIVGYVGVSSRDGTGIDELKELIGKEALNLDLMEQQWPKNWVDAEIALIENPAKYLSADDYLQICSNMGVSYEIAQSTLGSYLHDLGKLLYYQEDIALSDFVVLRPNWLTKAISRVLDDEVIKSNNGIFDHSDFSRIWTVDEDGRKYEKHLYFRFLRLMERFLISYRLEPTTLNQPASQSLVPMRLNHAAPKMPNWEDILPGQPEIKMMFRLKDFVPPGIMSWFIVLTHAYTQNLQWREGVRLHYKGHQAETILNPSSRELWLRVKGPSPYNFFNILQHTINDRILERNFNGLEYLRKVPCNCHEIRGAQSPCSFFHDYERLVARRNSGKLTAECDSSFEEVSVLQLLEGIHHSAHEPVIAKLEETKQALIKLTESQQQLVTGARKQVLQKTEIAQESIIQLRTIFSQRFNEEELRTFCFQLQIDYDDLPALGKSNKARELVQYLQRRGRVLDILHAGESIRPDIAWQVVFQNITTPNTEDLLAKSNDQNQLLLSRNLQYYEQLNRNFARFWNYFLKNLAVEFPAIFIISPEGNDEFIQNRLFETDFKMHMLCQYPAGPHLVCQKSYSLKHIKTDSEKFGNLNSTEKDTQKRQEDARLVRRSQFTLAAPWLKHLREFLAYIPQRGFADDFELDFLPQVQTSIQIIDAILSQCSQQQSRNSEHSFIAETQALQGLNNLFRQAEEGDKWCGLKKITTNDSNIFWLCSEHMNLFESL